MSGIESVARQVICRLTGMLQTHMECLTVGTKVRYDVEYCRRDCHVPMRIVLVILQNQWKTNRGSQ